MKRLVVAIVAVMSMLGGCSMGPASDGSTGTVTARKSWRCTENVKGSSCRRHSITVARTGSGTEDTGFVSEKTYNACQVGEAWPTCKGEK